MDNENKTNTKKGDGAPLTAPNNEEEQEFTVVDEESSENEDAKADQKQSGDELSIDDIPSGDDEGKEETNPEDADKEPKDDENSEDTKDKPKQRFSGAARKRYRYFLSKGMSNDEAREKAMVPVGPIQTPKGRKRSGSPEGSTTSQKRAKGSEGIKICIVLEKFPEELLTPEQSKAVQEAIMDQILELGGAGSTKPKFNNSTHQTGFLAIMCADQSTVEWLQNITPTLKPWEEASLKALDDDQMPHPETFVGFLPDSKDYTDEKILKLLEAQNESFNVSTWKVIKRQEVDNELELTLSIDRKYTEELKKAGYNLSYKFGQVQLWPKDKKKEPEKSSSKESTSRSGSKEWKPSKSRSRPNVYKGSSNRSNYRGDSKNYKRGWGGGRGVSTGYKGSSNSRSGVSNSRSGGGSQPWASPNYRRNPGQGSWYADSWSPWNR